MLRVEPCSVGVLTNQSLALGTGEAQARQLIHCRQRANSCTYIPARQFEKDRGRETECLSEQRVDYIVRETGPTGCREPPRRPCLKCANRPRPRREDAEFAEGPLAPDRQR